MPPEDYVVETLVRSPLIQHADSAAVWDGWLYFCTNQLERSPTFRYRNVDARKGPWYSYRVWIGGGGAGCVVWLFAKFSFVTLDGGEGGGGGDWKNREAILWAVDTVGRKR